jgi:TolB protein
MRTATALAPALAALMTAIVCGQAQAAEDGWREAEAGQLRNHVQLTFPDQFVKAGEQYFDPQMRWIIFQAVPVPPAGQEPDSVYTMYVAKLQRDALGQITGLDKPIMVSAPGSANTCGFFHPTEPGRIIFGSTMTSPNEGREAGYQRGSNAYRWAFPEQTEVVTKIVPEIVMDTLLNSHRTEPATLLFDRDYGAPKPIWTRPGYDAECAYSPDGRFIVHTRVDAKTNDPDLFIYDTQSGAVAPVVETKGYDGGPFFSPDGRRITYRSDRKGNDLLQLFVMDLNPSVNAQGEPKIELIEHQITDNDQVNWAPYWHPSGQFLVYATSEVSHSNYEVFSIEAPPFGKKELDRPLRKRRLTFADGFDGLPVFSGDGRWMMWTSQRGKKLEGQDRPSSQIWIAQVVDIEP